MTLSIIKLTFASLFPVIASIIFYKLDKDTKFNQLRYITKQIIIGLAFGGISIIGTEWGIPMNGVMVNCRDAAPLAAGLLFGCPAGIIAGIIGGVERWIAVAWGVGSFTRVACSISTMLAGFFAAGVRVFLFDRKKPSWGLALGIGIVMEVFHLTMVFVTNISDATKAISVIDTCFVPMVTANGLSVMFSVIAIYIIAGEFKLEFRSSQQDRPIFQTIQKWLLIVLSLSFMITVIFNYKIQSNMVYNNANTLVSSTIDEVSQDIGDASDEYMLKLARILAREVTLGYYELDAIADKYDFTDISVINKDGIITESNNPDYLGFDMSTGEQSSEFLCLLSDDVNEYVQPYGPISQNKNIYRKFAGISTYFGFVQVSYDAERFQSEVGQHIKTVANNRQLGNYGGVIILDKDNRVVSCTKNLNLKELAGRSVNLTSQYETYNKITLRKLGDGRDYYVRSGYVEGYYIVALYALEDAEQFKKVSLYVSLFSILLIFAVMFGLIYMLIKRIVVNQITKMASSLSVISHGNLNEVVNVRSNKEFSSLSDDINSTVTTLKRYIAEAAARIDKELEFARAIQIAALPKVFPERDDYEIYCFMKTAKEVGGDFYDFYMTNDETVNFLIADVSGKGIPAAMYMMRAKSVLRSCTERGLSVDDVFTSGNDTLCQENDAGMFVTAWQGALDLTNGHVYFANAGHNLPAIKHKDGKFELVKQKVNLVLGGMEGIPYTLNELTLEPGDTIFLYTDGVTEATNAENELFGDNRLLEVLNSQEFTSTREVCDTVMAGIDAFVKDADQFDDITMVCLYYKGPSSEYFNLI